MEPQDPLFPCGNCQGSFPVSKIDLHEAYCIKNIRKCLQCAAMIDIHEEEQHMRTLHSKKSCERCKQQVEVTKFNQHTASLCSKRPKQCKYCECPIPMDELLQHDVACGSRTKACESCRRFVPFRDYEGHLERCQQRRHERLEVSQDHFRVPRMEIGRIERERQNSTNNGREIVARPKSIGKVSKPTKMKSVIIIEREGLRAGIDPLPLGVKRAIKASEPHRMPLKCKN